MCLYECVECVYLVWAYYIHGIWIGYIVYLVYEMIWAHRRHCRCCSSTKMINSAAKLLFIIMLIWFRLSSDNGGCVNSTSWQHNALLHSDSHPCPLNSLCQCTNLPNETYLLEISCHEVSLYKFPGKFVQLKFVNNKLSKNRKLD